VNWNAYARTEPYFAVLTDPRFLRAHFDARAEAEFFASGETHMRKLLETARQQLNPLFEPQSILEFGCGPGRVAINFAHRLPGSDIVAVDSSPAMLELAAENARKHAAHNITFLSLDELLRSTRTFELVNASIVFHHIDPRDGFPLLRELLTRIADRGVGVFTFVYRRSTPAAVAAARSMRRSVPGVNRVAHLLLRKPAGLPFLHPYVYELSEVLAALDAAGYREVHVRSERQGDLDVATVFVRRLDERAEETPAIAPPADEGPAEDFIDVRTMIENTSIEELNRTAEQYFAGLDNWEHHLAKPFANTSDTPALLINVAILLQGLRLVPGVTVLELGAGTGWLSRIMTQLGAEAIVMDVSPTALKIAAELYERMPVIGERPKPRFLPFDGTRIDLPDESVDRIVTFDAFHHVTNPAAILAELGRVLRPGGIAAFAEPGPNHSKTPQSQHEMRTYGVVENDVDIAGIWAAARTAGFTDIRIAALNVPPFHVTLNEYVELLEGRTTFLRWADRTREFMKDVRNFFLFKGTAMRDSREAATLGGRITVRIDGSRVHATLENTGSGTWLANTESLGGVALGSHLFAADGTLLDYEFHREPLPDAVEEGASIELDFELPPFAKGTHTIEFDLVAEGVLWFSQAVGSHAVRVRVTGDRP
jgi:ubiquinone/menaquinone biosynthesis C-methylase UbiE